MKKVLLSAFALAAGMSAFAQGITTKAAYDDFNEASEFSEQYSFETQEDQADCSTPNAYMGIFTYDNKTVAADGFGLTATRNMTEGRLELAIDQQYGAYEPFGFIFGTYCNGTFGLDLSQNAMLAFDVEVNDYQLGSTATGTSNGETGVQMKIQVEDANGKSLVYDKSVVGNADGNWRYELGVTGDGTKNGSNFVSANSLQKGGKVSVSYDLKDGWPATNNNPDATNTFDYSKVVAIKITFSSATKDQESDLDGNNEPDYNPYQHTGTYYITNLKIGDVDGEGLVSATGIFDFGTSSNDFSVYPNPASSTVTFGAALTNVVVYNAQGVVVAEFARAEQMNVASLESGVYMVKSAEGSAKFVVK